MTIELRPCTVDELRLLAAGQAPDLAHVEGALPPPFVAERALQQMAEGKPAIWCSTYFIVRTADRQVIGGCGFKDAPSGGQVEVGYAVAPSCRRQGVATAALGLLVEFAFGQAGIGSVRLDIDADNAASMAVAGKIGFSNVADTQWLMFKDAA